MPDAGELVHDLLLLESGLHRIGQGLPGAASTFTEVPAERNQTVRGRGYEVDDIPLRIAAAHFVDLHIHDIAGDTPFHKKDLAVHMCQAVAFRSGRFDCNLFQIRFFLSAHTLCYAFSRKERYFSCIPN